MANTAFTHDPTITVPNPTVNNRVITWNGTTGKSFNNTALVTIAAGVVAGVTALTVDNLTIDGNTITSTDTNGNITLTPNGSGSVVFDTTGISVMSFNGVLLDIKNDDSAASEIRLYCDNANAHYQAIRAGQHSGATNYTMILPHVPPTANQVLTTASISSNVAVLDWADTASSASDTAYGSSWNGVVAIPPSKNAVYDKIETITAPDDTAYASSWNGVTTIAPSKNAVYDKIETMSGGNLVLIQSVEASTDSTIAITVNDDYDTYMIALASIRGSSNNNSPRFKFKNSSGTITSGYEWHYGRLDGTSTSYTGAASTSNNQLALTGTGAGNDTGEGSMGLFWFHRGDGLTRPSLIGTFNIISGNGVGHGGNFRGSLTSVDTITAIELSMDGGTIATGRFTIWGLKHD